MALTLLRVSRPLRRRVASASRARSTSTCARLLPHRFSDLGPQVFKNIDEPVRAYLLSTGGGPNGAARPPARPTPLTLPDKPSIAVLPFTNLSGDPEQEYFADGLVEDIITALSRVRSFFVIARNSSFTYKGRAVDVRQVSRELGVRYVLEGSIRKAGARLRIAGQLVDGITRRCRLGRPLRGRHQRHLRAAGQGHRKRGRRGRADHPPGRNPAGADQAHELHHGL